MSKQNQTFTQSITMLSPHVCLYIADSDAKETNLLDPQMIIMILATEHVQTQ